MTRVRSRRPQLLGLHPATNRKIATRRSPKSDQVLGCASKVCDPILLYRLMLFSAFERHALHCTILLVHLGGFNGSLWMIEVQPEGVSSPHQLRLLQNCAMIVMLNSRGKDLTG